MNGALLKKCWRESRWLLAACAAAIYAFCWLRVWMISRIDTARFEAIIDLLPGDWKKFTPVDVGWLVTYAGRMSLAYDEPIVVFGVSIWAIARGSDCVSGELNRGTMEMLLAQPLSRLQILLHQAAVAVVGLVVLSSAAWLGSYTGIHTTTAREEFRPVWQLPFRIPGISGAVPKVLTEPQIKLTPMSEKVSASDLTPASVLLFSLGFCIAGFSTLVSACDRYRWRTIGIVVGVYVVQTMAKLLGMASETWRWLTYGSFLTVYEPEAIVKQCLDDPDLTWSLSRYDAAGEWIGLGPLGCNLILLGIGYLAYVAAAVIFHRRDLPAPL